MWFHWRGYQLALSVQISLATCHFAIIITYFQITIFIYLFFAFDLKIAMIGNALERFSNAGCFKRAHESPERESGAPGKVRRNQGLELSLAGCYSHYSWCLVSCAVSTEKQKPLWELYPVELIQIL